MTFRRRIYRKPGRYESNRYSIHRVGNKKNMINTEDTAGVNFPVYAKIVYTLVKWRWQQL